MTAACAPFRIRRIVSMDFWQLRIFQKVIETEGFSKAAEAVHLTQPTISSHIRDLEEHFGCRLLDRMGKRTLPTGAGRLLYDYSLKITRLAEEAEDAMARFMGVIGGNLMVGGSTIPGNYILPRLIGTFKMRYPETRISIEVGDTRQIVEAIAESKIDFGVVGARVNHAGIIQEQIFDDEMRLIVPAGHRWAGRQTVTVASLSSEPFIMREQGSGTLKSLEASLAAKNLRTKDFTVTATLGSTTSVIQGIKSGIGVSILSAIAVADDVRLKTLVSLSVRGLDLRRYFYLTYHKSRSRSPLCDAFMDFLRFVERPETDLDAPA